MHDPTVYTGCATWAALWQAFGARGAPLSAAQPRDLRGLPGDGTHTVAHHGGRATGTRATRPRMGSRSRRRVERPLAWEENLKRVFLRFARIPPRHYGTKFIGVDVAQPASVLRRLKLATSSIKYIPGDMMQFVS